MTFDSDNIVQEDMTAALTLLQDRVFIVEGKVGEIMQAHDSLASALSLHEQNTGCDHAFVRDGEVKRPLGTGSYQTWNKYVCAKCLQPRFALVYEWNQYLLMGGAKDGSRIVDSLEEEAHGEV